MHKERLYMIPAIPGNKPATPARVAIYMGKTRRGYTFDLIAVDVDGSLKDPEEAFVALVEKGERRKRFSTHIILENLPMGIEEIDLDTGMGVPVRARPRKNKVITRPAPVTEVAEEVPPVSAEEQARMNIIVCVGLVKKLIARGGITLEQLFDAMI